MHLQRRDKEVLDIAARDLFGTEDVPYRRVLLLLASHHPDVAFPTENSL